MGNAELRAQELVLATGNAGKVRELSKQLSATGWNVKSQSELGVTEAEETGLSFVENAILKARHAAAQTGRPAVADDSGLSVEALHGVPGIYSARYAGVDASDADNVSKLLGAMEAESNRAAWFYCVLAFVRHAEDPVPLIAQGRWGGSIAEQTSGEGGFGYDPIFVPDGLDCTAAELDQEHKKSISHRATALVEFVPQLQKILAGLR